MPAAFPSVLAINAGSSSIKFAVYTATRPLTSSLRGRLERIGLEGLASPAARMILRELERRPLAGRSAGGSPAKSRSAAAKPPLW